MHHPFADNVKDLSPRELEEKLAELTSKFYKTANPQVREQIQTFIQIYRDELVLRNNELKNQQNPDLDLDSLIKIN